MEYDPDRKCYVGKNGDEFHPMERDTNMITIIQAHTEINHMILLM